MSVLKWKMNKNKSSLQITPIHFIIPPIVDYLWFHHANLANINFQIRHTVIAVLKPSLSTDLYTRTFQFAFIMWKLNISKEYLLYMNSLHITQEIQKVFFIYLPKSPFQILLLFFLFYNFKTLIWKYAYK